MRPSGPPFALAALLACNAPSRPDPPAPRAPVDPSAAPASEQPTDPAPATSAVAAPYDLVADLAARLADARSPKALGAKAVSQVESSVFLLVAARRGWPFDDEADLARRALPGMFHGRFGAPPAKAVTVFLFPASEPYQKFCGRRYGNPCKGDYGMYDPERRELVVDVAVGGPASMVHELVHVLTRDSFEEIPRWFDEGLASLYEKPILTTPGEIGVGPNKRHDVLVDELAHPTTHETIDLEALFSLDLAAFENGNKWLYYAMAHDFCWWGEKRGWLWDFYRHWQQHSDRDKTGRWSFRKVTGKSPKEASEEWLAWVKDPT
jgi:hypothetical protein